MSEFLHNLIRRPIAVSMCLIAIMVLGVLSLRYIPVSLMPDVDIPKITIQVKGSGMSAQEVDSKLISPLRGQLMQISGIKDMTSDAKMDGGSITLTFEPGTDMSLLFIEVNEKVDRAMNSLYDVMERPKVVKASAMDIPAMYMDIRLKSEGQGGDADLRFAQLGRFVKKVVSHRIEQIPWVAMVDASGTTGTEIVCIPDIKKTEPLGITNADIENAISANNITLGALSVVDGLYRYSIHFDSQILNKEDIGNIYLNVGVRLLQLKDICSVEERAAVRNGIVRHDGDNAVTLAIIKQNDAQMADLQASMDEMIRQLSEEYPDIDFLLTRDQTQLLDYSIVNLRESLIIGAIMACLVLFFFMRNWRMPLLIVITIPISIIVTLACFYLFDISVNIISLSGLILGVGMIVDNSIIVIDNIVQKYESGRKLPDAVSEGTTEVFTPMLSSVLTTCSVFVPLVFLSGIAGALFYDQAMGITTSLFASLAVATLVIPVYFFVLYKNRKTRTLRSLEYDGGGRMYGWYESTMKYVLRHWGLVSIAFVVIAIAMVPIYSQLKKERLPEMDYTDAVLTIDWNEGISVEENDRRTNELLSQVQQQVETTTSMVGNQEFILSHTKDMTASESVVYMKCADENALQEAEATINSWIADHYPKCKAEFSVSGNLYDLIFSSGKNDLEIHLQTTSGRRPDMKMAERFIDSMKQRIPSLDVQPIAREQQIRYAADIEQLTLYKISYQKLFSQLKELLNKNEIYEINSGEMSIPVIVGVSGKDEATVLEHNVTNDEGVDIPLSYLIVPQKIETYKRLYAGSNSEYCPVVIHGDGRTVEQCMGIAKDIADNTENLTVTFTGEYFDSRELIAEVMVVVAVAIMLLYFILAAQFESLVQPVLILSEVVIDVVCVMLVLWVMGESVNLMSMIGIVVMSGIIVNDSILKIDTINKLRRSGMSLVHAILVAGHSRLKPIVMTSLTTILAIIPFLHKGDMGATLQFPLSLTIVVGMIIGTLVSLFFVPMLYYIIYKRTAKGC